MFLKKYKIFHGIEALYLFNHLPTGKHLGFPFFFSIINNLALNIPECIILHLGDTIYTKIGIVGLKLINTFYVLGYFLTSLQ